MKKILYLLLFVPYLLNAQNAQFDNINIKQSFRLTDSTVDAITKGDTLSTKEWVEENSILSSNIRDSVHAINQDSVLTDFLKLNPDIPLQSVENYKLFADSNTKVIAYYLDDDPVPYYLNVTSYVPIYNDYGDTLRKGWPISSLGLTTTELPIPAPKATPCYADTLQLAELFLGIVEKDIPPGEVGKALLLDYLTGINTSSWEVGDRLYVLSDSTGLTNSMPAAPAYSLFVGTVFVKDAVNGIIGINVENFTDTDTDVNIQGALNGLATYKPSISDTVIAGNLYVEVGNETYPEKDLPYMYNNVRYNLNTTANTGTDGKARIQLSYGTDTLPLKLYLYIDHNGGSPQLAVNTTGYPDNAPEICYLEVRSAAKHLLYDFRGVRRSNNEIDGSTGNGLLRKIVDWIRSENSRILSGVDPTVTVNANGAGIDTLLVTSTSGLGRQFNKKIINALDSPYVWFNPPNGNDSIITDLSQIDVDADGLNIRTNNSRYRLTFFVIIKSGDYDCRIGVNVSQSGYATDQNCIDDIGGQAITSPPVNIEDICVRWIGLPVRYTTASGGTIVNLIDLVEGTTGGYQDERNYPFGTSGAGAASGASKNTYTDLEFNIVNTTDPTKILQFDNSGITTGTIRTLTTPDTSGIIALKQYSLQNSDFGDSLINRGFIDSTEIMDSILFKRDINNDVYNDFDGNLKLYKSVENVNFPLLQLRNADTATVAMPYRFSPNFLTKGYVWDTDDAINFPYYFRIANNAVSNTNPTLQWKFQISGDSITWNDVYTIQAFSTSIGTSSTITTQNTTATNYLASGGYLLSDEINPNGNDNLKLYLYGTTAGKKIIFGNNGFLGVGNDIAAFKDMGSNVFYFGIGLTDPLSYGHIKMTESSTVTGSGFAVTNDDPTNNNLSSIYLGQSSTDLGLAAIVEGINYNHTGGSEGTGIQIKTLDGGIRDISQLIRNDSTNWYIDGVKKMSLKADGLHIKDTMYLGESTSKIWDNNDTTTTNILEADNFVKNGISLTSTFSELNYLDGYVSTNTQIVYGDGSKLTSSSNFINSNGSIGIGASTPSHKLHIKGTTLTDASLRLESTAENSTSYLMFDNDDAGVWSVGIDGSLDDIFIISNNTGLGTPRFNINTSGDIGINTVYQSKTLEINDAGGGALRLSSNGSPTDYADISVNATSGLLTINSTSDTAIMNGDTTITSNNKVIHKLDTLQLDYDASNYAKFYVEPDGDAGIKPSNDTIHLEANNIHYGTSSVTETISTNKMSIGTDTMEMGAAIIGPSKMTYNAFDEFYFDYGQKDLYITDNPSTPFNNASTFWAYGTNSTYKTCNVYSNLKFGSKQWTGSGFGDAYKYTDDTIANSSLVSSGYINTQAHSNNIIAYVGTKSGSFNKLIANETGVNYSEIKQKSDTVEIKLGATAATAIDKVLITGDTTFIYNHTKIDSNLYVNGDISYELAHAEAAFEDSNITISVTQNVYTKITNATNTLFSLGDADYITVDGDSATIIRPGDYWSMLSFEIDGSTNDRFKVAYFKNGTKVFGMAQKFAAVDAKIISFQYYFENMVAGDDISIRITNLANNNDPVVNSGSLYIEKKHD